MEKLQVKKWENAESNSYMSGFIFRRDGKKTLNILFMNNLDLYFQLSGYGNDPSFTITRDYYEVYEVFDNLYSRIMRGEILSEETESELERNKKILWDTGLSDGTKIVWRSDDYVYEEAPYFSFEKVDDAFVLTFKRSEVEDHLFSDVNVRLRNSGSRYMWYNILFMRAFKELCKIDFENRQIHIEEYLLDEGLVKEKKLVKVNNK